MVEGVAEYAEQGKDPFRIYVGQDAINKMNPTFVGKPVYVDHVDEVDLENLQTEADGYVVKSFFNRADGKTWVEFLVVSDRGKEAIKKGWKLSNAYIPKAYAGGGENHGVQYAKEVTDGEYEHLAIVQNPRYEESVVLTPEQFVSYNEAKEAELLRLANSKETSKEKEMGFKFFKRTKVENASDLEGMMVELPLSKKEMALTQIINEMDKVHNMQGYANGDHMVKVGESEMSVNELIKKHMDACNELEEMKKKNAGEGEPGVEVENDEDQQGTVDSGQDNVGDRGGDHSLSNEDGDGDADDKSKDKKKNEKEAREKAAKLRNSGPTRANEQVAIVECSIDQVARGRQRYGSGA